MALADDAPEGAVRAWIMVIGSSAIVALTTATQRARVEHLVGRLERAATTDPLTGLLNRRGFEDAFTVEASRAERSGRPVGMLVADLDHFKALNDRAGHAAGDEALAAFARVLERTLRRLDRGARIGGEEFAAILVDADASTTWRAAERVRQAAAAEPLLGGQGVTVSLGVTSGNGSLDELMRGADAALYRAKAAGRNRTVADGPTPGA